MNEIVKKFKAVVFDFSGVIGNISLFAVEEIPGTIDIVKKLKSQGYHTALLSNVNNAEIKQIKKLDVFQWFDTLVLLNEGPIKKPDPKAFELLLEKLNLPADVVLFIDDNEDNVEAAQKLGIESIVFTIPAKLEYELLELEILK